VYSFPCNNVNRTCNRVNNNSNIKLNNVNDIKLNKISNAKLNNVSNIALSKINNTNNVNDIELDKVNDIELNKNNFRLSRKVIYMFTNITLPTRIQSTTTKGNVPLSLILVLIN